MRIGFAGTPRFAATILESLLASAHDVVRVFTQPPREAGRGRKLRASEVQHVSNKFGIETLTPTRLRGTTSSFEGLDALVVAAYGLILPQSILDMPRLGCFNVHASLLPRWRGAAPIEYAILNGDSETGVSIMQMTRGLDAGPVYRQSAIKLSAHSTTDSVTETLAELGSKAIVETLDNAECGRLEEPVPQDPKLVTLAPSLSKDAAQINWHDSATQIERQVRAFQGRGGAYTTLSTATGKATRVRIIKAEVFCGSGKPGTLATTSKGVTVACKKDLLLVSQVQLNVGKGRPMSMSDAMNGYADRLFDGAQFDLPNRETHV